MAIGTKWNKVEIWDQIDDRLLAIFLDPLAGDFYSSKREVMFDS
ncbi:MAG: hypothetical protein ABIK93_01500 [candidate division WOR-3 bacterium]